MKLTPKQIEKLTRLMMLTASDSDGEALAALRMAQKILAEAKLNWAEVLAGHGSGLTSSHWAGVKPAEWKWADDLKTAQAAAAAQDAARAAAAKAAAAAEARRREAEAAARWEFAPEVVQMLSELLATDMPPSIEEFVVSVGKQFANRGWLTEKQLAALRKIHRRNVHA